MDRQDERDVDFKLEYQEVSRKIIGCAFEVSNELGCGFLESVYEKSLAAALTDAGLKVETQKRIDVFFRSRQVGLFYADLLVENKIIVELKAVKTLLPEHEAQVINYLNASPVKVGLLMNFGKPKMEFKRFTRKAKNTGFNPETAM